MVVVALKMISSQKDQTLGVNPSTQNNCTRNTRTRFIAAHESRTIIDLTQQLERNVNDSIDRLVDPTIGIIVIETRRRKCQLPFVVVKQPRQVSITTSINAFFNTCTLMDDTFARQKLIKSV